MKRLTVLALVVFGLSSACRSREAPQESSVTSTTSAAFTIVTRTPKDGELKAPLATEATAAKAQGKKIDGGAWDDNVPKSMAPPLKKFFNGG